MKMLLAVALLALSFTTGFTCSKNTPDAQTPPAEQAVTPPPAQEQMGAPADAAAPAGEAPATGEAAPAEAPPAEPPPASH